MKYTIRKYDISICILISLAVDHSSDRAVLHFQKGYDVAVISYYIIMFHSTQHNIPLSPLLLLSLICVNRTVAASWSVSWNLNARATPRTWPRWNRSWRACGTRWRPSCGSTPPSWTSRYRWTTRSRPTARSSRARKTGFYIDFLCDDFS